VKTPLPGSSHSRMIGLAVRFSLGLGVHAVPDEDPAFVVAPAGSDAAVGTEAAPFATIRRALEAMRASAIKRTLLRGGLYSLRGRTFMLDARDHGVQHLASLSGFRCDAPRTGYHRCMPVEVLSYTCPKCRRGAFRSLPGADGKAYCPWCGDAVAAGPLEPPPPPTAEMFSLVDLAKRIAGDVPNPAAPSGPPSPDLQARIAESERRRELAEAELRREQEKKQEIKKAVLEEMSRLEAELNDTKMRVRRKDDEHGSALEDLRRLKDAKEQEWAAANARLQQAFEEKDQALRALQAKLEGRQKADSDLQSLLDASRAEIGKLKADAAAAAAERADLLRKLSSADAKLKPLKEAEAKLRDLQKLYQESHAKATGLQSELEKRDQRIKDLQLLVKTLGDRLNQLADRRNV